MKFVTVSELRAQAPKIITELESTGKEVVVTKNGKPVALIRPLEEEEFEIKTNTKGGAHNGTRKNKG